MFISKSLSVKKFSMVLFHSVFKVCGDPSVKLACSETQIYIPNFLHPESRYQKGSTFVYRSNLKIYWLPGTDLNRRPSGYKCPDISTRLGLSHHPSRILGMRVSGASPPSLPRRVRAEALVSAPSLNSDSSGLGSGLPFSTSSEGQASLNSPDFSTTISRGSCRPL